MPEAPGSDPGDRKLLVLQIDGLSRPVLERAIHEGAVPSLAWLLERGSHSLHGWCPGLPSQTSASQAGLLFGDELGIPAFRWYEKDRGRLMVSNHPGDAAEIERRARHDRGLLAAAGSSVGNLLSGGAPYSTLTMSTMDERRRSESGPLLTSPRFWARELALMAGEIRREIVESTRQRLERRRRRVNRGGSFPVLRAVSTVLVRDLTARVVAGDIRRDRPAVFADFVGYDVVAHHAGPDTRDALDVLARLDPLLGRLLRAAERHGYAVVVLSDHGQTPGRPFRQRYGGSLQELVGELTGTEVSRGAGTTETWGHANRLLSELVGVEHVAAHVWRLLLRPRLRDGYVETGPDRRSQRPSDGEVVVCASGNLGHVYLTKLAGRADLAAIRAAYPRLVEGLARHAGIDYVLVRDDGRPVVLGPHGRRRLDTDAVEGTDPLASFGPDAADHLRALDRLAHTGDLVLNGHFDPEQGTAAAFEEFVGSHGGLGGPQTEAFLAAPAGWRVADRLEGPAAVNHLLREHLGEPARDPSLADRPAAALTTAAGRP